MEIEDMPLVADTFPDIGEFRVFQQELIDAAEIESLDDTKRAVVRGLQLLNRWSSRAAAFYENGKYPNASIILIAIQELDAALIETVTFIAGQDEASMRDVNAMAKAIVDLDIERKKN